MIFVFDLSFIRYLIRRKVDYFLLPLMTQMCNQNIIILQGKLITPDACKLFYWYEKQFAMLVLLRFVIEYGISFY